MNEGDIRISSSLSGSGDVDCKQFSVTDRQAAGRDESTGQILQTYAGSIPVKWV